MSQNAEYIYLLTNEHIPKLVKIGYTTRHPKDRAREISQGTGVPGRWVVEYSWLVDKGFELEQEIFEHLRKYRLERSEMFELTPEDGMKWINKILDMRDCDMHFDRKSYELEKKRRHQESLKIKDLKNKIRNLSEEIITEKTKGLRRCETFLFYSGIIIPFIIGCSRAYSTDSILVILIKGITYGIPIYILCIFLVYPLLAKMLYEEGESLTDEISSIKAFVHKRLRIAELDKIDNIHSLEFFLEIGNEMLADAKKPLK